MSRFHYIDSLEMASMFVLGGHSSCDRRDEQNENINTLNYKRIKLEDSLQLKVSAINNMLGNNLGPVNLLEQVGIGNNAANAEQGPVQQLQLPVNNNDNVFCAVILTVPKQNVVIKLSWIKNFSLAKAFNKGLKSNTNEIVFYSKTINDEADFSVPILAKFNEKGSGLYVAKIHRYFGNKFLITIETLYILFLFVLSINQLFIV
jgi:hypothetical protein